MFSPNHLFSYTLVKYADFFIERAILERRTQSRFVQPFYMPVCQRKFNPRSRKICGNNFNTSMKSSLKIQSTTLNMVESKPVKNELQLRNNKSQQLFGRLICFDFIYP